MFVPAALQILVFASGAPEGNNVILIGAYGYTAVAITLNDSYLLYQHAD